VNLALSDSGISDDTLLGGKVRLRQPVAGYRVAIDPVLLAAAVPASENDAVLDIGCGVGAAALCLAARVPGCRVTGMDRQRDLVALARDNIALNDLTARMTALTGDLLQPNPQLEPGSFSQVMANPPFLEASRASLSPNVAKVAADIEGDADLTAWVDFALAMVRPKGGITFIHRADRLADLLAALSSRAGEITVFPLWPGAGKQAKRVIVQARKGVATPLRLMAGLVLHQADGRNTEQAEAILRHGAVLPLVS
jgi:tRNA1(Val) A37 N6-methylase TrmN6